MDAFDPDDHAAIKGALVACMQGKWSGHTLHASALVVSGHHPSLEFQLVRAEFDGEPCVQVVRAGEGRRRRRVRAQARGGDAERPGDRLPAPAQLHREAARAPRGARQGRRALHRLRRARQVRGPARGARRADGRGLPLRLRAPAARAAAAGRPRRPLRRPRLHAARRARQHAGRRGLVRARRAQGRDRSLPGGRQVDVDDLHGRARPGAGAKCATPEGPANDAYMAHRQGREMGGNRVQLLEHTGAMLRLQDQDRLWVQADQGGADGEPLPPGAAADREPRRRGPRHVRRAGAHARRAGPGSAAVRLHAGCRAQRPHEERRPLGRSARRCRSAPRASPAPSSSACRRTRWRTPRCPAGSRTSCKTTKIEPARIVFQVREEVGGAADQGSGRAAQGAHASAASASRSRASAWGATPSCSSTT